VKARFPGKAKYPPLLRMEPAIAFVGVAGSAQA